MKRNAPIALIMSRNVIKLNLSDDLTKAETLFKKHKIRHLPVVDGNRIIGMLSYTDLLRISYVDAVDDDAQEIDSTVYNLFTVQQVMSKDLVLVTPLTTVRETAQILSKSEFHALPVCEGPFLVGIVTTTDLVSYLADHC